MSNEARLTLSFREDISFAESGNGVAVLRGSQVDIPMQRLSAGWLEAMRTLSNGGATEGYLAGLVLARDGPTSLFHFQQMLGRLGNAGLICSTLQQDERPLATIVPLTSRYRPAHDVSREQPCVLSRFAYVHREGGQMVLECPLGHAKVILHSGKAMELIGLLDVATTWPHLATRADIDEKMACAFMGLLASAEALSAPDENGKTAEDSDAGLAQWEFHDLLFHARSRMGRHRTPYGGSFRWRGRFEPLPPVKPAVSANRIALFRPDLNQLNQDDRPFSAVLEARRSVRDYDDDQPITERQLGEFLYRSARVKQVYEAGEGDMSVSFRPYPAGGALYELEVYAVVDQCSGITGGLYHYDPLAHELELVAAPSQITETLLQLAWNTANRQSRPQVSLHITARFQRVQWKYQSLAYSLILKDVGSLYQTMYLVATALGLAPCALGGGDAELFATAASLDYYQETSVGEFVLGSVKRGSDGQHEPEGRGATVL